MNVKKQYPIELLKIIEPICQKGIAYIKPDRTSKNYKLLDKDPNSNYYFEIGQDFEQATGGYFVSFERKPYSGNSQKVIKSRTSYKMLGDELSAWIDIVRQSNDLKSIYDDHIAQGYQQEFFEELQIDALDDAPVGFKDLPKLEEYIGYIEAEAETLEDSEPEKEEIKLLCDNLKSNLTKESKAQIFKQITMIWALFTKSKGYTYTKKIMKKLIELSLPVLVEKGIGLGARLLGM